MCVLNLVAWLHTYFIKSENKHFDDIFFLHFWSLTFILKKGAKYGYIEKQGKEWQKEFWNSHSFIFANMGKSRAGKFKIINIILNFPTLDFLVGKVKEDKKEREFQKYFCHSLPYFYTYPGQNIQINFS